MKKRTIQPDLVKGNESPFNEKIFSMLLRKFLISLTLPDLSPRYICTVSTRKKVTLNLPSLSSEKVFKLSEVTELLKLSIINNYYHEACQLGQLRVISQ